MGYECICDDKYIKGLDLKRLIDTPQDLMNQLKKSEKLSISMEGAILFSMNVEDKSIPVEIGMKRKELNKFEIASF
jgi:translation initiation factor 2B subunit (eIF-2B alpha/beta/delta family)